ncbi:MAG: hypothetical protein LBU57_08615, partial [Dysgonamonadaceae bacterium]|nr:hypothetical protein [Dysgonamonadaceae bacterium]
MKALTLLQNINILKDRKCDNKMTRKRIFTIYFFAILFSINTMAIDNGVRGWIILSNNMDNAIETIKTAKRYNVNHLQLSHQIVHDLREVKDKKVCDQVNHLTRLAHSEKIDEVF